MPSALVEKAFCTTREAAQLLGVSVGTVQLWVESGLLKAWKTAGGHRRVMRDSVDNLLHKSPGSPLTPSPLSGAETSPKALRVMVVDDDEPLLRLYQAVLATWPVPLELVCLNSAFSALIALGRGAPDLLVSDLHMPGMDGFEMLWAIRKTPELADTSVVVVSGLDAPEITERGGIPPGIEILPKPVPFARLLDIASGIAQLKGRSMTKGA